MKISLIIAALALNLTAAAHPDFSGAWEFASAKSTNIGMMAGMKLTAIVRQGSNEIVISNKTDGQTQASETRFDLSGKPVENETPMGGKAETVAKWDGAKLVTTWTSPGSVAGTQTVRTETRWLSSDGSVMTVESTRGKNAPMVMVYERK